jgi:unsaturated chondroitin disaccharide hydrolase
VHFDPETGEPYKKHTHQGYAPEGCWARGLGWCAYGFLEAHRATGREDFLDITRRALDYHARRTPVDPVTFNDYDDPRIPAAPRDTSAAAILASAAIETARVTGDERYRREGDRLLEGLIGGYLTPVGPEDARPPGMLLHGCYNLYSGEAPDHELIWGDYFLLEALLRRQGSAPG